MCETFIVFPKHAKPIGTFRRTASQFIYNFKYISYNTCEYPAESVTVSLLPILYYYKTNACNISIKCHMKRFPGKFKRKTPNLIRTYKLNR